MHIPGTGQASLGGKREVPYINHIELVSRFVALLLMLPFSLYHSESAALQRLSNTHTRTHTYTRIA